MAPRSIGHGSPRISQTQSQEEPLFEAPKSANPQMGLWFGLASSEECCYFMFCTPTVVAAVFVVFIRSLFLNLREKTTTINSGRGRARARTHKDFFCLGVSKDKVKNKPFLDI